MVGVLFAALDSWRARKLGGNVLQGKVPINLNYTTSKTNRWPPARNSAILQTVVTPQNLLFLEKVHIEPPGKVIYVEDLGGKSRGLSGKTYSTSSIREAASPPRLLERSPRLQPESLRSTTTAHDHFFPAAPRANPKGVVLSHFKSPPQNVEQLEQVFPPAQRATASLGIPPLLPLLRLSQAPLCLPSNGRKSAAVFHPSPPRRPKAIAALVSKYSVRHAPFHAKRFSELPTTRRCPPEILWQPAHRDGRSGEINCQNASRKPSKIISAFAPPRGLTAARNAHQSSPSTTYDFRAPPYFPPGGSQTRHHRPSPSRYRHTHRRSRLRRSASRG